MGDGFWIVLIFCLILLPPILIVLLIRGIVLSRRRRLRERCTASAEGVAVRLASRGLDRPTVLTAVYTVDGRVYRVSETFKYRSEAIQVGKIPVGQRRIPRMGPVEEGCAVTVRYDPAHPEVALIEGNDGFRNV